MLRIQKLEGKNIQRRRGRLKEEGVKEGKEEEERNGADRLIARSFETVRHQHMSVNF